MTKTQQLLYKVYKVTGMRQQDIANLLYVSRPCVAQWEAGRRAMPELSARYLAHIVFDVPLPTIDKSSWGSGPVDRAKRIKEHAVFRAVERG